MKRERKKKDYFTWWTDRVRVLRGMKDEAKQLYARTGVAYEVGPWAVLKLAILQYYVSVYTTIIKSIFGKAYYLDLFSGPGLNLVKETGSVVLGSPLIAERTPNSQERKFDKLLLIEKKPDYCASLRSLLPNAIILNKDVNEGGLDEACSNMSADTPCLAFVDPEGFELHWATLSRLLGRWCDAIINFQASQIGRVVGSAISRSSAYAETLDKFFGTPEWRGCHNEIDYLRLYETQIRQHKEYTIDIKVQGPGGFYYYMIVAIRKTKGAQGWINAIERAKANIEKADYQTAEKLLAIFEGKQSILF